MVYQPTCDWLICYFAVILGAMICRDISVSLPWTIAPQSLAHPANHGPPQAWHQQPPIMQSDVHGIEQRPQLHPSIGAMVPPSNRPMYQHISEALLMPSQPDWPGQHYAAGQHPRPPAHTVHAPQFPPMGAPLQQPIFHPPASAMPSPAFEGQSSQQYHGQSRQPQWR